MSDPLVQVTEAACQQLCQVRDAEQLGDVAIRVKVSEEGAIFRYEFGFVRQDSKDDGDTVIDVDNILLYLDAESLPRLRGATLDFIDDLSGRGFRFDNPNRPRLLDHPLAARVQQVLEEHINPMVASHGGRVALMEIDEDRVFLSFGGGCQGCGMVDVTLKEGIEGILRQEIPEIREVLDITNHAEGSSPYYSAQGQSGGESQR